MAWTPHEAYPEGGERGGEVDEEGAELKTEVLTWGGEGVGGGANEGLVVD
jgi:hypothetical protein